MGVCEKLSGFPNQKLGFCKSRSKTPIVLLKKGLPLILINICEGLKLIALLILKSILKAQTITYTAENRAFICWDGHGSNQAKPPF